MSPSATYFQESAMTTNRDWSKVSNSCSRRSVVPGVCLQCLYTSLATSAEATQTVLTLEL